MPLIEALIDVAADVAFFAALAVVVAIAAASLLKRGSK